MVTTVIVGYCPDVPGDVVRDTLITTSDWSVASHYEATLREYSAR